MRIFTYAKAAESQAARDNIMAQVYSPPYNTFKK